MKRLFSRTVLPLIVLLALSGGVAAEDTPGMYVCGGAEYDNSIGYGTTLGTAVRLGGSVWVLARGVGLISGDDAAVDGDVAYIHVIKGWRLGLIAGPDVNWIGEESTLTYITGSVGALGGYIHDPLHLGALLAAKYKIGSDGFKDGWRIGLWLVYGF